LLVFHRRNVGNAPTVLANVAASAPFSRIFFSMAVWLARVRRHHIPFYIRHIKQFGNRRYRGNAPTSLANVALALFVCRKFSGGRIAFPDPRAYRMNPFPARFFAPQYRCGNHVADPSILTPWPVTRRFFPFRYVNQPVIHAFMRLYRVKPAGYLAKCRFIRHPVRQFRKFFEEILLEPAKFRGNAPTVLANVADISSNSPLPHRVAVKAMTVMSINLCRMFP
jgi:hypothetical protein